VTFSKIIDTYIYIFKIKYINVKKIFSFPTLDMLPFFAKYKLGEGVNGNKQTMFTFRKLQF